MLHVGSVRFLGLSMVVTRAEHVGQELRYVVHAHGVVGLKKK